MRIDKLTEFADGMALTGGAGRALAPGVIDLRGGSFAPGGSRNLYAVVALTTAGAGTGPVEFQLVSDAQAAIATDGSATVFASTGQIATSALMVGWARTLALPLGGTERYLGLIVNRVGAMTGGVISAFLTLDPPSWAPFDMETGR